MKTLLPVTVLSGFLGAGKTTLLKNLLENKQDIKIAVIVNDMSEINIDARLIDSGKTQINRKKEKLIEMTNGCICCTLREDLLQTVRELAQEKRFDYLLVESSGISEPLPVAETFTFTDSEGVSLSEWAYLDCLVTVVDASRFQQDFNSEDDLVDRNWADEPEDERSIVNLLVDQIEFANVIVLNKVDLVESEDLAAIEILLSQLNPQAKIYRAEYSRLDASLFLHTRLFDAEQAEQHENWLSEVAHVPETENYGISSFVYRARRPFHPERLSDLLNQGLPQLLRSKGFVWLAHEPHLIGQWSQAGQYVHVSPMGYWWSDIPAEEWPVDKQEVAEIMQNWQEPYADRRTELVLIGQYLDPADLTKQLDYCLLSDAEAQRMSQLSFASHLFQDWIVEHEMGYNLV